MRRLAAAAGAASPRSAGLTHGDRAGGLGGVQPAGARPAGRCPPDYGQDPLIDRLGLRRAWELSTGRGVTVAVVDSGVDARHPKLAGAVGAADRLPRRRSPAPAGFEVGPGTGEDCENHGTPIAGLIAGRAGRGRAGARGRPGRADRPGALRRGTRAGPGRR